MNFLQLKNKFGRLGNTFCYIDTSEQLAVPIFISHNINIKVTRALSNPKYNYLIYICKVPKRYHKKFYECMQDLIKKMMIFGYTNYEKECLEILTIINSDIK